MKITVIYGQNHKGSTYHIARMLAEKLGGEITEFFLPRDFGEFCVGCGSCFQKSETLCPHYQKLLPIKQAMDQADVLIFASPVYVYHVTGAMKAFLDHFGYRWMVHRPEGSMFTKQAVCVSTAAGAGMQHTNKDIADSMFYWGVAKTYRCGIRVQQLSYDKVSEKIRQKADRKTTALAQKILRDSKKIKPSLKTRLFFEVMRKTKGLTEADRVYWQQQGWLGDFRPWKKSNVPQEDTAKSSS